MQMKKYKKYNKIYIRSLSISPKRNISNVPTKMRIPCIQLVKLENWRINSNFVIVEKRENLELFKTFFLILKLDIKKCPKWILKKKFQKMKTTFFSTFFLRIFFAILYDKWCSDFCQKGG